MMRREATGRQSRRFPRGHAVRHALVLVREEEFDVPTQRPKTPLPMLYQGGYLTIKGHDPPTRTFTLSVPGEEANRDLSKRSGPLKAGLSTRG